MAAARRAFAMKEMMTPPPQATPTTQVENRQATHMAEGTQTRRGGFAGRRDRTAPPRRDVSR
ncbi:MAG: hypothetical protein HYV09_26755 [Deltaproteobacteria bacterium]|nr:hypothetical protein [Deltaproteobacteria bacterium]